MVKMKIPIIGAVLLVLTGCDGVNKLLWGPDEEGSKPAIQVVSLEGVWRGHVMLNGSNQLFDFILIRQGDQITNESLMFSTSAGLTGNVSGPITGNTLALTGTEGSLCVNLWSFACALNGSVLTVTMDGDGNNIPGTSCYPNPVHETFTMTH